MRQRLIPVGDRGDIVLERQIAAIVTPTERLHGDAQVGFKADRVHNMPAIHAHAQLRLVIAIGSDHLMEAGVRRGKCDVTLVVPWAGIKVVRAAEIVFGAGATDCGILIAIEVEL